MILCVKWIHMKTSSNFEFTKKIILEDERVILRPLENTDVEHLLEFSLTETELWQYSLITAAGEKGLKSYLNAAVEARHIQKEYPFIVFDKQLKEYCAAPAFAPMASGATASF